MADFSLGQKGLALFRQPLFHGTGHIRGQRAVGQRIADAFDHKVLDGLRGQLACRADIGPSPAPP